MYFTEGSTDYNDPHYQDDWTKWSKTYTDVLNNWCRAAVAWNMATDEHGKPNIGPYPCGGILIINPHTQEIIRSGQYWALAHFSRAIRRGARRFESQSAGGQSWSRCGRESRRTKSAHPDQPRACADGSGQSGTEFSHSSPGRELDRNAGLEVT